MDPKIQKQIEIMIDERVRKGIEDFKRIHRITQNSRIIDTATDAGAVVNKRQALGVSPSDVLGYYGNDPVAQQTVTGSRGGNTALRNLLIALNALGLVVDSST